MGLDVGSKGGVRSDINITPLVDVVLVLLIIFMVVTPMLQRGKHVELPKARHVATATQGQPDPLFVTVTKRGSGCPCVAVATCRALGSSTCLPRWSMGVTTMKMINSTSTTSTSGVMLMSERTP